MNKTLVIGIIVFVVIALGALYYWSTNQSTAQPTTPTTTTESVPSGEPAPLSTSTIAISSNAVTTSSPAGSPAVSVPPPPAPTPTPAPTPKPTSATITYTDNGFSPTSLMIAQGTKVTFVNNASDAFWPASNVHPTHSLYDGTTLQQHCADPTATTFDACGPIAPGSSWSFTFTKTGTWTYHNHLNPSEGGTITVQ